MLIVIMFVVNLLIFTIGWQIVWPIINWKMHYPFITNTFVNKEGVIYGIIFFLILWAIFLSPLGTWYVFQKKHIRKPGLYDKHKIHKIDQLLSEIFERAGKKPFKYKIYISDTTDLNAYAIGMKVIVVTPKILNLNEKQLLAVLLHEYAHLYYGDSIMLKLSLPLELFYDIATNIYRVLFQIFSFIISIVARIPLLGIVCLFLIPLLLIGYIISIFLTIYVKLHVICRNYVSRRQELRADRFAVALGYGEYIRNFISDYIDEEKGTTHPNRMKRLRNVERLIQKGVSKNYIYYEAIKGYTFRIISFALGLGLIVYVNLYFSELKKEVKIPKYHKIVHKTVKHSEMKSLKNMVDAKQTYSTLQKNGNAESTVSQKTRSVNINRSSSGSDTPITKQQNKKPIATHTEEIYGIEVDVPNSQ